MWAFGRMRRCAVAVAMLTGSVVVVQAQPAYAAACTAESNTVWVTNGDGTCDQTSDDGTVVKETVTYDSDGLEISGIVCRPKAEGPHPILVANHGGFEGVTAFETSACDAWARTYGYIVVASDYRLFDEGTPYDDFCLGEVDDVLRMVELISDHADADNERIVMRGFSHGGCVTLRAYQEGVPGLVAAAVLAPPTDITAAWNYAEDGWDSNGLCWLLAPLGNPPCFEYGYIMDLLTTAIGGPPTPSTQAAYDARSAIEHPELLTDTPLLISQGVSDVLVPPSQTCSLADAINDLADPAPTFGTYHFDTSQALLSTTPTGCTGYGFTFPTTGDPTTNSFPSSHYLLLYDGWAHSTGAELPEAIADADEFLRTKNP